MQERADATAVATMTKETKEEAIALIREKLWTIHRQTTEYSSRRSTVMIFCASPIPSLVDSIVRSSIKIEDNDDEVTGDEWSVRIDITARMHFIRKLIPNDCFK